MIGLKHIISQQDDVRSVLSGIKEGLREQLISGLSGSARTLFLASVYEQTRKPMIMNEEI